MTQHINITLGLPWSASPCLDTTVAQIGRACGELDLFVEYRFNEIKIFQRDPSTEPPTGAQLAAALYGPDNTATIVEEQGEDDDALYRNDCMLFAEACGRG